MKETPSSQPRERTNAGRWRIPLAVLLAVNLLFVVRIPAHALWNLADHTVRQIDFSFLDSAEPAAEVAMSEALVEGVSVAGDEVGGAVREYSDESSQTLDRASTQMGHWIAEFTRMGKPEPIHTAPSAVVKATEPTLVVVNAYAGKATVQFTLNGKVVALQPGQSIQLATEGPHVVLFHRGGNFGNVRHALTEGRYGFDIGSTGWELRKLP